jgi:cytochrome c oxidase subunit III
MTTFEEKKKKSYKPMLWISMASMAMVFAGLTSAFVVRKAEGNWLDFDYPGWFYVSTGLILLSSLSMIWAKASMRNNNVATAQRAMATTFVLGVAFAVAQYLGWGALYDQEVYFTGPGSNASGSFVYVITLLHLLHLAGGLIALLVTWFKMSKGRYNSENMLGVELCAIFWHFLDILWVYLFLFFLYIR